MTYYVIPVSNHEDLYYNYNDEGTMKQIRRNFFTQNKLKETIRSGNTEQKQWIGAMAILGSALMFAFASVAVKKTSMYFHTDVWLISFIRFIIGAVMVYTIIKMTAGAVKIRDWKTLALRGLFGSFQMVLFYLGVKMTSSGRATLLGCTAPIWVAVTGFLFFHQKIRPMHIMCGLLVFIGAVIVFYDGSHYSMSGNLVSLASGVFNGIAIHYVIRSREKHSAYIVYLSPCIFGIAISSFSVKEVVNISSPAEAGMIILVGIFASAGQILMAFGMKFIQATVGSILGMAEILFSMFLSLIFVSEKMPVVFFIGAFIIIFALTLNHLGMKKDKPA
jgi:drug/metabolite transporter (DMT)-like permease